MLISCRRIGGKSAGQWLRIEAATSAHSLESVASCYCDSDKLMNFAWQQFGQITHGLPRVQAFCDWGHHNIEYRFLSGRADLSVSEVIERRLWRSNGAAKSTGTTHGVNTP